MSDEDKDISLERDFLNSANVAIKINRCIQTYDQRINV
jgi:hypothetical protein